MEVVEIMDAITVPFEDLDAVVEVIAGTVESAVLPAVLARTRLSCLSLSMKELPQ